MKNPGLRGEYKRFIKEYEDMGHMAPIRSEDFHRIKYFIPHSCVVKQDSTSTKLRVVFDASAKTNSYVSLKDIQVVGPTIQRDLFDLLIEFRTHNKVLVADIAKMYQQVRVAEDDTWLQCILWRNEPKEPIKAYRLTTVTYGETSSSYLACRALHDAGEDYRATNPTIADAIQRSFYVDNLMIGAATVDELSTMKGGIERALLNHRLPLRKWAANDEDVLCDVPEEDLEQLVRIGHQEVIKTLGVAWNPKLDTFQFIIDGSAAASTKTLTRRQLLSRILRLYDPIGLIQPVIITAKMLMQELTLKKGTHWDDEEPSETLLAWKKFESQLAELQQLEIPRTAVTSRTNRTLTLHGFSDASMKAYGCVIYLHAINLRGEESRNLLCAKSRVAPSKGVTLP